MVDFKANVGHDWKNWNWVIEKYEYDEENKRGERLMYFCLSNNLMVMNTTFYQKKAKH